MADIADIDALLARLRSAHTAGQTYLVAIDGFGGSGKSTLARQLCAALPAAQRVPLDDFYVPALGQPDRTRLLAQVLRPLKANQPAKYQRFDWSSQSLLEWQAIAPGGVVVVEGTTALHPDLASAYDLTVWIDLPQAPASQRGLARDRDDYHVDTRDQWEQVWMPAERDYFQATQPHRRADIIFHPPNARP
jgi:uridine kinase